MVVSENSEYEGIEKFGTGFGESNIPVSAITRGVRICLRRGLLLCLLMHRHDSYRLLLWSDVKDVR
jgi:hypothetical protein